MKFYIMDFSSKCNQIRRKLQIWSHLLEKSIMENFIFCAVNEEVSFVSKTTGGFGAVAAVQAQKTLQCLL